MKKALGAKTINFDKEDPVEIIKKQPKVRALPAFMPWDMRQ
jgi:hypothetical protein